MDFLPRFDAVPVHCYLLILRWDYISGFQLKLQ
jgi:hypothetical protein